MDAAQAKSRFTWRLCTLVGTALLALAACAPQATTPTAAPAKPAPTVAPAQPAPTVPPAKAEAPAAKPAPTAVPAAKPTEKPAAKPAEFDEKAVADFYKGKTIRIVVGFAPGGSNDMNSRVFQKVLSKYLPGNPNVVVENRPGGGGLLAANTVYNSEPKDGTVIVGFSSASVLQQATGQPGVQFDAGKYNWLGSTQESFGACAVRTDAGITSIQDTIEGGKEITVSSYGTTSNDPPAVLNAALGTRFKIISGYDGGATQILAVKNKEVQGWCTTFDSMINVALDMLEGSNPAARVLVVTGAETPNHPFLKGVPAGEKLARTDEGKALLRALQVPMQIGLPHAVAPEVPKDRVQALRRARDKAYADPELLDAAQKAQIAVNARTGEEVQRIVQEVLNLPPATLAKLKTVLQQ